MTKTGCLTVHLLVGLLVLLVPSTVARGSEIWIQGPQGLPFGDFPFHPTSKEAQFRFVVPDNFVAFRAAKVVLIARTPNPITYDLHLSISQDGFLKDHYTDWMLDLGPILFVENEIVEINVSTIFPPLAPGNLVQLRFDANPRKVKTLGLRFQFEGPQGGMGPAGLPGDATGATGPAGSTGPAGAGGATGPAGFTGPAGAAGATSSAGSTGPAGAGGATGPAGFTGPAGTAGATDSADPTGSADADGASRLTISTSGVVNLSQLDASRLLYADPSKDLMSVSDLTEWIAVSAPIAIADDGDGTVTISAPTAGATGPAGPTGPAGAAGATGPAGPTGPAGAAGATGPAGSTGPAGADGATGPSGSALVNTGHYFNAFFASSAVAGNNTTANAWQSIFDLSGIDVESSIISEGITYDAALNRIIVPQGGIVFQVSVNGQNNVSSFLIIRLRLLRNGSVVGNARARQSAGQTTANMEINRVFPSNNNDFYEVQIDTENSTSLRVQDLHVTVFALP